MNYHGYLAAYNIEDKSCRNLTGREFTFAVQLIDAAGNRSPLSDWHTTTIGGCCCSHAAPADFAPWVLALALFWLWRRRRLAGSISLARAGLELSVEYDETKNAL